MNLRNMKIGARLNLLIALLSALLMAIGAYGVYGISQSNESARTIYESNVTLRHIGASDFRHIETSRRVSDGHHSGVDFAFI